MIKYFQSPEWTNGIWTEKPIVLKKSIDISDNEYPVLETPLYKGLESDGVILVSLGKNDNLLNELYVGVSRARGALAVVIDSGNSGIFRVEGVD